MSRTRRRLFTSESVTEGHPDKVADQISDAVLDAVLTKDPLGRVACETALTTGTALVFGEISTDAYVDIAGIVRRTIKDIGYVRAKYGFDYETCGVLVCIDEQSPDIAQGVNTGGAGDQGMMFGFACDETPELMPAPIQLAHGLARRLSEKRRDGTLRWARPDGKTQVTVEYDDQGRPVRVDNVLVSIQHSEDASHDQIFSDVQQHVVEAVIPSGWLDDATIRHVNPTGRFVIGGPQGDAGLTGRKIIVDSYGGYARHGGGAFSGKDPTKVDRSAAYGARWVAKNIVAAGMATKCEIQVAYAIGVVKPVSVLVETFGTETVPVERIEELVTKHFDLSPFGIIAALELRRPIYRQVAAFGHFGRHDLDLPWERTDRALDLAEEAGTQPMLAVAAAG
ncbi:MAG: methionine adenosyltransferase [Candidatus Dormibacteraeota bacterium]|uniref:S-adenosylmethionine synthase n=1 Tax=Candidatus Amunia macphersoniae TaxID=3127014 RepID=A0A934NGP9_9BACT|nr:methionine adenosyltransferase [Candidatus Dormibacteraeota bacterium]